MMKIVTIVGARPQFIKASMLSQKILATSCLEEVLVHTGQHYDHEMSQLFFNELKIPRPHYQLNLGGGSHGAQTAKMLEEIEKLLLNEKPDVVLVYGDTNSTLAGALAAAKLHIPVAHVEAGLRSYNRQMPEEINRVLTDHVSEWLFIPTVMAKENLLKEGIADQKIFMVGDIMYDAALYFSKVANRHSDILSILFSGQEDFVLTTIHRAENLISRERLRYIINMLNELSKAVKIVFPLHPHTKKVLLESGLKKTLSPEIIITKPLGYLDMLVLEQHAKMILTDSGGIQKEAFFFKVPCITFRDETEWVELIDLGWNKLLPPADKLNLLPDLFLNAASEFECQEAFPYGEGKTAEAILSILGGGSV